jgi:hypothetical protein
MMSENPKDKQSENERDVETGEPVTVLAALEQDTSATFLTVVRRKIRRRSTASQFASFSWNIPKMILIEFWGVLVQLLSPRSTPKGGQS